MQLECVITCVNYDDLLGITLPQAMYALALEPVVVTSMADERTCRCVRRYGGRLFQTDRFYRNGAAFNKAAALNAIIKSDILSLHGWILMLDADIFLPDRMREAIEREVKDKGCLYGAPRIHCPDKKAWEAQKFEPMTWKTTETPGYFHLFWAPNIQQPWYDESYEHAGGYDSLFQKRWDKAHKVRLSFPVIHLGRLGQNWFGRRTKRWDGIKIRMSADTEAIERAFERHKEMKAKRRSIESRRRARLYR